MVEENISQGFRLKNIDETINYFLEEIKQNKLMNKKDLYNSELYWILSYFSFYNYWISFNFCFCFFDWYSYRNY